VGHYGRNGFFYSLDRVTGKFIKAEKYVNDLNWTKGIHPRTGMPLEYDRNLDVQIYNPEAACVKKATARKRACPTWHGGVAHQPLAYHPLKNIAYGVGTEGCFTQTGAAVRAEVERRRRRHESKPAAPVLERSLLWRDYRVRHRQPQSAGEGRYRNRNRSGRP